jgi:hypothetical protein
MQGEVVVVMRYGTLTPGIKNRWKRGSLPKGVNADLCRSELFITH